LRNRTDRFLASDSQIGVSASGQVSNDKTKAVPWHRPTLQWRPDVALARLRGFAQGCAHAALGHRLEREAHRTHRRRGDRGRISTDGDGLATVALEGPVCTLAMSRKIIANGADASAVRIAGTVGPDLSGLRREAPNGRHMAAG
jgi:hypothetical protein